MTYNVALIPGDGIGREVLPEGVRVLEKLAQRYDFSIAFEDFPLLVCLLPRKRFHDAR